MFVFFFNDTATTEIYTLSLHDALPICGRQHGPRGGRCRWSRRLPTRWRRHQMPELPTGTVTFLFTDIEGSTTRWEPHRDRKSTRLNSSHAISRMPSSA